MKAEAYLKNFTEEFAERAVFHAQNLIRCRTYNPPGNETEAAAYAKKILEDAGYAVTAEEFQPKRWNVTATAGNPGDIALILNGHLDVVPAFGEWEREPSGAQRENGILYGRGSCDMLGGVGGILAAAECASAHLKEFRRGIMVLLVADEEDMNRGIDHILASGTLKADAAVIGEPTSCEIHLGNRGFSSFYIRTSGRACHASEPWNGENAIYKMAPVISAVEKYAESLKEVRDPYLGAATACIGTIRGGIRLNTVPDGCEIEMERRLLPGESREEVHRAIQSAVGETAEVADRSYFPASLIDRNDPLVHACEEAVRSAVGEEPVISAFRACTEASKFSVRCGIPTLLLGPGSIDQAHRINEFCPEEDIRRCSRIYYWLIGRYAGLF